MNIQYLISFVFVLTIYHVKVVYYDESEDLCDIKYIDYGGYDTVPADSLRQIRTDFLTLPFQVTSK